MGTSSSRGGNNAPRGGAWSTAKGRVTSFVRGTGSSASEVLGGFVAAVGDRSTRSNGATGGGHGEGRRAGLSSSIRAGRALGGFLGSVGATGLDDTLRARGLDRLIGESPQNVLAGIADYICGNGGLLDDHVARSATLEVLAEIFDYEDDTYADIRDRWQSQLDAARIQELMTLFLSQSIFQRFLVDLGNSIESNALSVTQAAQKEQEVLEFIKRMVTFELGELNPLQFDWQGPDGEALIQRNLSAALGQLEV